MSEAPCDVVRTYAFHSFGFVFFPLKHRAALFRGLCSIHEIVSHLGYTHVVLEGPLVAVNRQLPKEHPIHDLLKPHLEGTAMINWGAQNVRALSLFYRGGCGEVLAF